MRRRRGLALLLGVCALIAGAAAAACESDERTVVTPSAAAFVPVVESSELYVGQRRLVLTLLDRDRQPQFGEDVTFRIRYFDPTEAGIKFHSEAELRSIEVGGLRYLIASDAPFETAGQWAIAVTVERPDGTALSSPRLPILVAESARGLVVGERAPSAATPTAADGLLERMAPVDAARLAMYERSAAELLASGEPFLIVWASAERCAGRQTCARALAQAAAVLAAGRIAVLHVEPFGRPRAAELQALIDDAAAAWGIEAEPQWFVVDGAGRVTSRFEIVVADAELDQAIAAVLRR